MILVTNARLVDNISSTSYLACLCLKKYCSEEKDNLKSGSFENCEKYEICKIGVQMKATGEAMALGMTFEEALLNISKLISPEYYMKCCFTCQYSDYSPYGNDSFGTMLCYKKQKEDYLKVHNKREYFQYLTNDYEVCQETDLCMEYDIRMKCEGYRGFVTGILDIELP